MATRFYRRAEEAATIILEAFTKGDLPKALAPVFVRRKDEIPCRAWSWSNQLLTALAGYSDARGYRQWEKVGRKVKKGEKSFAILCPCVKKSKETDANGEEKEKSFLCGFTSAAVFGYEQTEGDPLPPPDPEIVAWLDSLPVVDVAKSWGLSVDAFNGEGARYLGMYRPGAAIALGVKNLSTWAHELVHAADDQNGTITKAPGQQPDNEIVAELGGAILLEIFGHEVESDRGGCFEYVERYAGKTKIEPVTACMRLLKRTCECVALILDTAEQIRDGEPVEVAAPAGQLASTPPAMEKGDDEAESFALMNDPPRPKKWAPPAPRKTTQKLLFAGLDCLPGQRDLFATDGEEG